MTRVKQVDGYDLCNVVGGYDLCKDMCSIIAHDLLGWTGLFHPRNSYGGAHPFQRVLCRPLCGRNSELFQSSLQTVSP